jgi:hypothetical protein
MWKLSLLTWSRRILVKYSITGPISRNILNQRFYSYAFVATSGLFGKGRDEVNSIGRVALHKGHKFICQGEDDDRRTIPGPHGWGENHHPG